MDKAKTIPFRLAVNIGDCIYSLWSVRQATINAGLNATYYHQLNKKCYYYTGAQHGTLNQSGETVGCNQVMFDMMKPLMESFEFIEEYLPWNGEKSVNLDRIRSLEINMPFGHIAKWYGYAFPDLICDVSEPLVDRKFLLAKWGKVIPTDILGSIIVNRTARYRNPFISYGFLNEIGRGGRRIYFVGTHDEYSEFQDEVNCAIYLPVGNFLELAVYIGFCKLFIGNQSFCFALAEAMKTTRVLEVCSFAPNVIPTGQEGFDFYNQEAFEYLVDYLGQTR